MSIAEFGAELSTPTVAEMLRGARLAAPLTQREAGLAVGVTAPVVSAWENGSRVPSTDVLRQLGVEYKDESGLADSVRAARLFEYAPADTSWTFHPEPGRGWLWVRGVEAGEVTIRWGPWRVALAPNVDPSDGFVITSPYATPAPPLFVTLPNPGWVALGKGHVPEWLEATPVDVWPHIRACEEPHQVPHFLARLIASPRRTTRVRQRVLAHLPALRASQGTLDSIVSHLDKDPVYEPLEIPAHSTDLVEHADTPLLRAACLSRRRGPGSKIPLVPVLSEAATIAQLNPPLTPARLRSLLADGSFTHPSFPALLDRMFSLDGRSFCAAMERGTNRNGRRTTFPSFWRGPVWVRFEPLDGTVGARDVTLTWGAYRKDLRLSGPCVVETRCCGDQSDPLVVDAPGWQVRTGMGRHRGAYDVNERWIVEQSHLQRLIRSGISFVRGQASR